MTGGNRFVEILILLLQIHKIGDVQESIAFQANIHERRLHSRQNACHTAFVNRPC
jgi:hypothetical protein